MVLVSLKEQLRKLLKPELLIKVHSTVFPFPKASKFDWEVAFDAVWEPAPARQKTLYKLVFPILLSMSRMPLEELKKIDMLELLPERSAPDYLERCVGLVFVLDQTREFLVGADTRYTRSFFDPLAEKAARGLFGEQGAGSGVPADDSPFRKEIWLANGWTFEDYALRIVWIWGPLIHSESFMHKSWDTNKGFLLHLRSEVERYSNKSDPYAPHEAEDEKDLSLMSDMLKDTDGKGRPTKAKLGRELEISDCMFWLLRILIAHWPIIDRFGRYPLVNDMKGRDFAPGELEWMESTGVFKRLPENDREVIRRDVENGTWTLLKGNSDYD